MHVLFLTDNFPPETNAPATRTHEHARRWVRAGHRVTVVTGAPNFPAGKLHHGWRNRWFAREELDGIQVIRVKTFISANRGTLLRTLDYLSFMVAGFLGALVPRRPDVVVATSPQFFTAVAGWAVAALRRKRFVFELRDLWPASIEAVGALRQSRCLRAMERVELFLYRRAWRIVAVTNAFRDDLIARGVDGSKIAVVTNGVDLDSYVPRDRDADTARRYGVEGRTVIGYLGTHGMAHALEKVLDAAEALRDRDDVHFLFVGDGAAKRELVTERERRGLDNVSFHAPVAKDAMPALWSLCDVALVHLKDTPVFETVIPSKIFEAMGSGRTILFAGPAGEASRILEDADCGLCVPAEDSAALAAAVRRLADDPAERSSLATNAHRAAPRYGRDALAARMLEVLGGGPLEAATETAPRASHIAAPVDPPPALPAPPQAPRRASGAPREPA
ncbi:MAG: glycosyltransferase family 4 protein [Planctomycetes bacterium]|nr:glycosyltransferase family 4 protein [Planctomycetota bacterium]